MIDRQTGSLIFANGEVKPQMKLAFFLESEFGKRAKKRLEHDDWLNYGVEMEDSLEAVFAFKGGRLVEIYLSKQTLHGATWAEWSETDELNRKIAHDALLEKELGSPPYRFSWGIVESVFDEKGGGSQIVIRFL